MARIPRITNAVTRIVTRLPVLAPWAARAVSMVACACLVVASDCEIEDSPQTTITMKSKMAKITSSVLTSCPSDFASLVEPGAFQQAN